MPQHAVQPFPVSEEYVKNPEIKPEDIAKFRQWVRTQPHLPDQHISGTAPNSSFRPSINVPRLRKDRQASGVGAELQSCSNLDLVLTYHCCDRSAEVAKQVLDLNLTLRTMSPIFAGRDVDDKGLERAYHIMLLSILPTRTPEGYAVFYQCLVDCDPKNFVFPDVMKAVMMTLDLYQVEQGTWPGLVIVLDMKGVQLAHLSRLEIQTLQHFMYYLQEAFLAKLKAIHYLNAPSFMDKLLMILKPFMKKQLMDMLHIHQPDSKAVDEVIPKAALPKEYGGQHKDINTWIEESWQKVRANREYFAAESERRVNEAKRPGRPRSVTDLFGGVEGSFKKLDID
ncbi:Alpha-tocopherol transfer protein-like [Eumeta japonica]|uniref:Alpha-tocopherol transfer protein-like n=1 Tax=Eumeta variegata TaxID=151549 RepID=A0A4C1ZID7_EUMVA|nr:Alpha-tocopherol transfer protein-like [Eumeta japonica]